MDQLIAIAIIFPTVFGAIRILMLVEEHRKKCTGEWYSFQGDKMRRWVRDHWSVRPMTAKELADADDRRDRISI